MNSYINVPSPYRSCLSSIITVKIKFLALSLKAVKKNQSYFSALQPGKQDSQRYTDSLRNAHLSSDFHCKGKAF